MLRMMTYRQAEGILHCELGRDDKCIAKGTALDNHADPTPLNTAPYNSFPRNRLVPVSAVDPTVFTITFINGSDNSVIETRLIDYGQPIGNPPAVTPASGYTFTGNWSPTIPATATANGTYTAVCEAVAPTTYTITFLDKDGNLIETRTFTHGATITTPTPPTVSGYVFDGWKDLSNNPMPATATSDATYKATYTNGFYGPFNLCAIDGNDSLIQFQLECNHSSIIGTSLRIYFEGNHYVNGIATPFTGYADVQDAFRLEVGTNGNVTLSSELQAFGWRAQTNNARMIRFAPPSDAVNDGTDYFEFNIKVVNSAETVIYSVIAGVESSAYYNLRHRAEVQL